MEIPLSEIATIKRMCDSNLIAIIAIMMSSKFRPSAKEETIYAGSLDRKYGVMKLENTDANLISIKIIPKTVNSTLRNFKNTGRKTIIILLGSVETKTWNTKLLKYGFIILFCLSNMLKLYPCFVKFDLRQYTIILT